MDGEEQVTLGEVARAQTRIERKLDSLIEAEVVARLKFVESDQRDIKEQLRWYGRWLLGIVGSIVVLGAGIFISAGGR